MRKGVSIWEKVIIGFLYPAVLGAIIYEWFSQAVQPIAPILPLMLGLAIIMHYCTDYAYSVMALDKKKYNIRAALCDLVIIIALFVANKSIWDGDRITMDFLFISMAGTKVGAIFWDLSMYPKLLMPKWDKTFLGIYGALAICSILGLVLQHKIELFIPQYFYSLYIILSILLISGDAAYYIWYIVKEHRKAND